MTLPYDKEIDDIARLRIDESFKAHLEVDEQSAIVQLESEAEAMKLIAEFEDRDGELCYADDAIMGKYEALHYFRP
jgi:hypothetical protein